MPEPTPAQPPPRKAGSRRPAGLPRQQQRAQSGGPLAAVADRAAHHPVTDLHLHVDARGRSQPGRVQGPMTAILELSTLQVCARGVTGMVDVRPQAPAPDGAASAPASPRTNRSWSMDHTTVALGEPPRRWSTTVMPRVSRPDVSTPTT